MAARFPNRPRRIWVHQHFPRAIAGEQVRFFLQPQADVLAGRLEGVEMLVRWRRKDGRWNAPGKFMSVVEGDVQCAGRPARSKG